MKRILTILFFYFFASEAVGQGMFYALNNSKVTAQPILDQYPGAYWAFGLKKLSSSYSGYCLQLRFGTTYQNIGFDSNGYLDTMAINALVGSGVGRVSVWYDQSGNGLNATVSDTSHMPIIRQNNSMVYDNGNISMAFQGAQLMWLHISTTGSSIASYFSVLSGGGAIVLSQEPNAGYLLIGANTTSASNSGIGTPSVYVNGASVVTTTRQNTTDNVSVPSLLFPIILSALNLAPVSWTTYSFNREASGFFLAYNKITLSVMYYSDKTPDRAGIENNIKLNYGL